MDTTIKTTIEQSLRVLQNSIALLLLLAGSISTLPGQTGQTGNFVQNGETHRINQPGFYYTDYTVPQPGAYPYLALLLRGGDGGKVWIENIYKNTVRTGKGGQGATVSAIFKIGTGGNELKPGSKIRFIVGRGGGSTTNCHWCTGRYGAGGGGGTGVLYLPLGADETLPANWKILAVAGGGGGGVAGTGSFTRDGYPGQTTEYGYVCTDLLNQFYSDGRTPVFGHNGSGGQDGTLVGAGGGTSFLTWKQAANGAAWGNGIATPMDYSDMSNPADDTELILAGEGGNRLMGQSMNLLPLLEKVNDIGGNGLFQSINGTLLPVGGMGGSGDFSGGYGCGGGGGGYNNKDTKGDNSGDTGSEGGGGGGYSGGWPGITGIQLDPQPTATNKFVYVTNDIAGGGGGSYINSGFALPASERKIQNGTTDNTANGYVDYQFFATNPIATRDLYFECHKGTEVQVLKSGVWTLLWQYDGNLVLYGPGFPNGAWASNTAGGDMFFQGDGNLVIYQSNASPWSTDTPDDHHNGKGGRKLVLTPDGSLFITDQDGKVIWKGH